MVEQKPIGQFLLEQGIITPRQIEVALSVQKSTKGYLGEILEKLNFVTSEEIARAIASQQEAEFIRVEEYLIDPEVLRLIPKEVALDKKVLPLREDGGELLVAVFDTTDITTIDYLHKKTGLIPRLVVADKEKLRSMIELHYYQLDNPIEKRIEKLLESDLEDVDVVKLLDLLIENAIKDRATDIHITPDNVTVHVFFRIDGVLKHYYAFDLRLQSKMVARTKILANLDIAEQRLPQDGGFSHTFLDQEYDLRLSTLPTDEGENIVMRLLARSGSLANLEALGLSSSELAQLKSFFLKPFGMVLVTGPTGSGKTTTLYAALREVDALSKNVLTVEDPIEYHFSFMKQTQINEKSGYTFAKAIRHFMRQDPDVMLVGEIRDHETAQLAVRASITGHLVLSTLHTNDAVGTIPRLLDMGIDPDLVSTALLAVVAQRLVRRVCSHCAEQVEVDGSLVGEEAGRIYKIFKASENGCDFCKQTGYYGRTAVIELLPIDEVLKSMIAARKTTQEIIEYANSNGMKTMRQNGLAKVIEGITTLEEINRVTL